MRGRALPALAGRLPQATADPDAVGYGGPKPADGGRAASWLVGAVVVAIASGSAVVLQPGLRHWYVLPVSLCGILIIPDAVDFARGRLDTFDPRALVGLMGTYFFFVTPLLHVVLNYWALYVDGPADWRNALGRMAVLNLLGLSIYRAVLAPRPASAPKPLPPTDDRRLRGLAAVIALVGFVTFGLLVGSLGGPASYVQTVAGNPAALKGLGYALLISTAFPAALLILVLSRFRDFFRRRPVALVPVLLVYVAAELFVGGVAGSRSHTVWSLVIGVGLCHLLIKPVRRAVLGILLLLLVAFMYFYGFYKSEGTQAFSALQQGESISDLSASTGRNVDSLLLGDFGRADVQALLLDRVTQDHAPLAHGETYIGDLTFLVPHSLRVVPTKVQAGTDVMYGKGSYTADFQSSYVYGLAGEATLNFGPVGAVLAFLPFGLLVRAATAFYRRCQASPQARGFALMAPGLALGTALILTSDLDNLAWFLLNYVFYAVVLALGSSRRGRVRPALAPSHPAPATLGAVR